MRALTLCLLGLSLSPCLARADAISMPMSCPPHSEAVFCHGPPTCGPRECLSSSECAPGEHCAVANLCVVEHGCGGWGGGSFETHVLGLCGPGDSCEEGSCSGMFVCVAGGSEDASVLRDAGRADASGADASGTDAGDGRTHVRYGCDCHCSVGASPRRGPAGPFALASTAALLGWVHRRRGRRPQRSGEGN
jgi:hypothetical protein